MSSAVLFSTGAPPTTPSNRNLVEFKAGKMEMRGKMVHPVKRKGLVYMRQSPDDSLMHFCWKDRQTGVVEDDLILFPDDCEFKRVKECTTGRVFVLKMKSSNKKMFFWMQEAKTDKDEEYCKKINEMLNNPPRPGSDMGSSSERDFQAFLGNMTQEQVAQLLNSSGVNLASLLNASSGGHRNSSSNSANSGSSTSSANNSGGSSGASASQGSGSLDTQVNIQDLGAILSNALMEDDTMSSALNVSLRDHSTADGAAASDAAQGQQQQQQQQPMIDLSTAVNSDSLAHLLEDENFLRQLEPHLPPITQQQQASSNQQELSKDELKRQVGETIRSSQFRSSLSQFCVALQSGQLGPLMSQFGLNQACVDAANLGNLEAFVRALDEQTQSTSSTSSSSAPGGEQKKD